MVEKKLVGKVTVITGAASGIGKTTAILFVNEGESVVVADIGFCACAPLFLSKFYNIITVKFKSSNILVMALVFICKKLQY